MSGSGTPSLPPGRRNTGIGAPRVGVTESITAPGITPQVPTPPVRSNRAEALLRFLQTAAGFTGALADISEDERREKVSAFNSKAWLINSEFDAETFEVGEGQTPQEAVTGYVDRIAPKDLWPDESRQRLLAYLVPKVARVQHRRQREQTHNYLLDQAGGLAGRLADDDITSPDVQQSLLSELTEFERRATEFGWSRDEFVNRTLLTAARASAGVATSSADVDGVKWLASLIGQQYGRGDLAAGLIESAETGRTRNLVDRLRQDIRTATDRSRVRSEITRLADSDELPESAARELLAQIALVDGRELAAAQEINRNALELDVLYERRRPDELAADIHARSLLPPTDPMHLPAGKAKAILTRLTDTSITAVRKDIVRQTLVSNGRLPPLLAEHDEAFEAVLVETGALSGAVKDQTATLTGVADPLRTAAMCVQAQRVPGGLARLIRAGMDSPTPERVNQAAGSYAHLCIQSPQLAESVRDGMTVIGKLRARYISTRLEAERPSLSDHNNDPQAYSQAVAERVATLTDTAMTLKLAEYSNAQADKLVWSLPDKQRSPEAAAFVKACDHLKDAMPKGLEDTWRFGFGRDVIISADVVNEFRRYAREEFIFARSLGQDEPEASETALAWAVQRTLAAHCPILWNGTVRLSSAKGLPASGELEQAIIADIESLNLDKDEVESLREDYHPVWDERQSGFVFVNDTNPVDRYVYRRDKGKAKESPVSLLVVNPFVTDGEKEKTLTIRQQAENWRREHTSGLNMETEMKKQAEAYRHYLDTMTRENINHRQYMLRYRPWEIEERKRR